MSQYQGGNAGADTAEQAEERRDADRRMSPAQDEGYYWQWQNQLLNGNERRNEHRRQVDNTQTD